MLFSSPDQREVLFSSLHYGPGRSAILTQIAKTAGRAGLVYIKSLKSKAIDALYSIHSYILQAYQATVLCR